MNIGKQLATLGTLLLGLGLWSCDNGSSTVKGGNTMETENAITATLVLSNGSPAKGATAVLCKDESPLCASGIVASDTANDSGKVVLPLPDSGLYVLTITNSEDTFTVSVAVTGTTSTVNLGTISSLMYNFLNLDSGMVDLAPEDTTYTPVLMTPSPTATLGTLFRYQVAPWSAAFHMIPNGSGAFMICDLLPTQFYGGAVGIVKVESDGTISAAKGIEKLMPYNGKFIRNFRGASGHGLPNGDLVVTGNIVDVSGYSKVWIAVLSPSLDIRWAKFFRVPKTSFFYAKVTSDPSGNILVAATSSNPAQDSTQPRVFSVDGNGTLRWDMKLDKMPSEQYEYIAGIEALSDGSALVASYGISGANSNRVFKVSAAGALQWTKQIQSYDAAMALSADSLTGTFKVAAIDSLHDSLWLHSYDASGSWLSTKTYDVSLGIFVPQSLRRLSDGGFLLVGSGVRSYVDGSMYRGRIFRLDSQMDTLWTDNMSVPSIKGYGVDAVELSGGALLIGGNLQTPSTSDTTAVEYSHLVTWLR